MRGPPVAAVGCANAPRPPSRFLGSFQPALVPVETRDLSIFDNRTVSNRSGRAIVGEDETGGLA